MGTWLIARSFPRPYACPHSSWPSRRRARSYRQFVTAQVARARSDADFAAQVNARWQTAQGKVATSVTPTGLTLPRHALPFLDEPGAIARFLFEEGLPGEFPFLNAAYAEMYLPAEAKTNGNGSGGHGGIKSGGNGSAERIEDQAAPAPAGGAVGGGTAEEPTRLFAGMGVAEDTNERFHYLSRHQRSKRLSTAFDGPTLYGTGSGADGVFGKIGEGGVAVDTIDDMERLYAGFALDQPNVSTSMTINGPAPIILAMYVAAAKRRFGADVAPKLRGTIQADVLKEVQAQNEMIFPLDASLRFLADMVQYTTEHMPKWYPISISGYHIAEAGATPCATGRVHAEQWFRVRRVVQGARHGRERLRAAVVIFPRLRAGHRIPVPRAGLPQNLGGGNEGCVRRGPARANPETPHTDERAFAHRRRMEEQPHAHGHRADPRVYERDELLPFQRRR